MCVLLKAVRSLLVHLEEISQQSKVIKWLAVRNSIKMIWGHSILLIKRLHTATGRIQKIWKQLHHTQFPHQGGKGFKRLMNDFYFFKSAIYFFHCKVSKSITKTIINTSGEEITNTNYTDTNVNDRAPIITGYKLFWLSRGKEIKLSLFTKINLLHSIQINFNLIGQKKIFLFTFLLEIKNFLFPRTINLQNMRIHNMHGV